MQEIGAWLVLYRLQRAASRTTHSSQGMIQLLHPKTSGPRLDRDVHGVRHC